MSRGGTPESLNPYGLSTSDHISGLNDDFYDYVGKRRIYPTINGTTGVFVTIGQSRIANNSASGSVQYVCTNLGKCINLNPYDGQFYTADDPVLGASASTGFMRAGWHGRLCDKLINAAKYTQVVMIPIAMGGSSVTDWDSGGIYHDRIRAASALLTAMSITPTAWLWQQGTTDSINGMGQTTYQTALRSIISYQRGLSGRSTDKWMIALDTIHDADVTSSALRAAQTAVAGDSNNSLGPDCDTLTLAGAFSDGTHFTNTGNDSVAGLWSTKIQAAF